MKKIVKCNKCIKKSNIYFNLENQKGFTLIELLSVIVVLALIALISIPIVIGIIEKTKKSAFLDNSYGIMESAEIYYIGKELDNEAIEDKIFTFNGENIEELKYNGINPDGVLIIKADGNISLALHNNKYCTLKGEKDTEISIKKYQDGECIIPDVAKDPVITLKGNSEVMVKQNGSYIEEGLEAKTVEGETLEYTVVITKDGEKVESIDTATIGTVYTITYTATNNNKTVSATRIVTIVDGIGPVITVPENTTVPVTEIGTFDLYEGVTIEDNIDGTIEANSTNVKVKGELGLELKSYTLTYTVSDSVGNESSIDRVVTVVEAEGPILNFSSISTDNSWLTSITVEVTASDDNNLGSFSYQLIKNGVEGTVESVTLNENSASTNVVLNETGIYKIKLTGSDEYGNTSETESEEYKIDIEEPTIVNGAAGVSNITKGKSSAIPGSYFSITSSNENSGTESIICKEGSTVRTNTSTLSVGSHIITCTVTRGNGLSASLSRTFVIKSAIQTPAEPTEIVTPENAGENCTVKEDTSGNKRYAGSNPNNYVCFGTNSIKCSGKQLWRIIGIVDGSLKLISTEYYSTGIAFGGSSSNPTNRWNKPATLNTTLHNNVYNSTKWINSSTQKGWMLNNKWRLAAVTSRPEMLTKFETGEKNVEFTTSNYVGIMTMTDFGYASGNSKCTILTNLGSKNNECMSDNWLRPATDIEWTLSTWSIQLWVISVPDEYIYTMDGYSSVPGVRPVVFLDSNVKIKLGSGTETDPYILTK